MVRFIDQHRATSGVESICRQLPIAPSTYFRHKARHADPTKRSSIYGVRFIVSFTALALALPLVAWVHRNWGFDVLFQILAVSATCIFLAAALLPRALPQPAAVRAAAG